MTIFEPASAAFVLGLVARKSVRVATSPLFRTLRPDARANRSRRYLSSQPLHEEANQPSFDTVYHAPVMWKECIAALLDCERGRERINETPEASAPPSVAKPLVFVDGTLGGGGHSAALLQSLRPGDVVIGCDVDSDALTAASDRLSAYLGSRHEQLPLFVPVRSNFCDLASLLPTLKHPIEESIGERLLPDGLVDGLLLDLGVSSHQIDTAERGFAFLKDGPLDMRMAPDRGLSAADVCNEFVEQDLRRILKEYGDDSRARAIAQSIVQRRPLHTTNDLVEAVAAVTPEYAKTRRFGRTATLARVFQAIRIVVNEEDKVLEQALTKMAPALLRPGGRLAVLSYHSIEDRIAKRVIRDGVVSQYVPAREKDIYGNYIGTPRPFRSVGKRKKASSEEVELNSRARSAGLRVAERNDS